MRTAEAADARYASSTDVLTLVLWEGMLSAVSAPVIRPAKPVPELFLCAFPVSLPCRISCCPYSIYIHFSNPPLFLVLRFLCHSEPLLLPQYKSKQFITSCLLTSPAKHLPPLLSHSEPPLLPRSPQRQSFMRLCGIRCKDYICMSNYAFLLMPNISFSMDNTFSMPLSLEPEVL